MSDSELTSEAATREARAQEVLRRRAERLRRSVERGDSRHTVEQIAVLGVGAEQVGIPVGGLRELVACPAVAALPGLPAWFVGIVQIRGELISVVDLARWLSIECAEPPTRLAVVEGPSGAVGLLAHSVIGFRELTGEDVAQQSLAAGSVASRLLRGVTNDLVAILDVERLLADRDLIVGME